MNLIKAIILFTSIIFSVEIVVQPYLQNATPNSIHIMWETSSNNETLVNYGLNQNLSMSEIGNYFTGEGSSVIHNVSLSDLLPNTRYYYQVTTSNAVSEIFNFITPPDNNSEPSFKLVAMSDMQIDYSNSNKFHEIVHEGILNYFEDNYSTDIPSELAFVLIPGDLVENGNSYYQWEEHFFGPSHPLFAYIPIYPVLGNHEVNTNNYFKYFNLPDNGSNGYEEHWWYLDYSNTRIIGLDSNSGYQIQTQLNWLDDVLEDACSNSDIDFVFAQLHHPYLSELWIAGNTDYTGDVIERLEEFSTLCGKPSVHFFGHTHGYSRGQSLDHNHLWVNVATAGGNIDYWNEYAQVDYEEFTVSQDEWGFVLLNVDGGDDPRFTLKRISRGNENQFRDNELRDILTIRKNNIFPDTPLPISPQGNISPDCFILQASSFIDMDNDLHISTQWQIDQDCEFNSPEYDIYRTYENWYNNQNLQEEDFLTDEFVLGLQEYSEYCWRVRYRDESLGWSEWSSPLIVNTLQSNISENLLLNPGAENGTNNWSLVEGNLESILSGECDAIQSHNGNRLFGVGGVCENESDYGEAYQLIDISNYTDIISSGSSIVYFGGYLSNYSGSDMPEFNLEFLDINQTILSQSTTYSSLNSSWTFFNEYESIPEDTYFIKFIIMGTRNSGLDNDSYFDDMYLRVSNSDDPCSEQYLIGDLNEDNNVNILDVIVLVNIVLGQEATEYQLASGDANQDGILNILDIIYVVNIILNR